jgi:peptidoglycan/xylan/chitin deacetylase (PgdA/CDA1 family)
MNKLLLNLSKPAPIKLLRHLANCNLLILNYHAVSDIKLPYITNLYPYRNVKTFSEDLDFMRKHYQPIGLSDLLSNIKHGTKLPKNSVMLTFDDGFRVVYDVIAPILLEKKMTATFFLTKNYIDNVELGYDHKKSLIIENLVVQKNAAGVKKIQKLPELEKIIQKDISIGIKNVPYIKRQLIDRIGQLLNINFEEHLENYKPYLTSDHIENLINSGFTIGGHSIDHPLFPELSTDEQVTQATMSVEYIKNRFGLDYQVFAFPYSDKNIGKSFFDRISDKIDITFGTSGLIEDSIPSNYQRISVEKHPYTAADTIKYHYFRKFLYRCMRKDIINR